MHFDIKIRQFTWTDIKVSPNDFFFSKTFDVNFVLGEYFTSHTKEALLLRHLRKLLEPLRLRYRICTAFYNFKEVVIDT